MILDDTIRLGIEKEIDSILEDPFESEQLFRMALFYQGIEPNLETILSHVAGLCFGKVLAYYQARYDRVANKDESIEFFELMKRRAGELRDAFIKTRLESS